MLAVAVFTLLTFGHMNLNPTQNKWKILPFQLNAWYTHIAFTVVTGEELNALTEVMNALTNLQAEKQAKGVKEFTQYLLH